MQLSFIDADEASLRSNDPNRGQEEYSKYLPLRLCQIIKTGQDIINNNHRICPVQIQKLTFPNWLLKKLNTR